MDLIINIFSTIVLYGGLIPIFTAICWIWKLTHVIVKDVYTARIGYGRLNLGEKKEYLMTVLLVSLIAILVVMVSTVSITSIVVIVPKIVNMIWK